jgi:phage terminase large subunit
MKKLIIAVLLMSSAAQAKQHQADELLFGPQRHTMLVGGSRSGKTFELVKAVMTRAIRTTGSRHAIFRLRTNAIRTSIGMDTLPKVMKLRYPGINWAYNRSESFATILNKTNPLKDASEVWLSGLDDKERVEKLLGKEYTTEYFNECSQIPYHSVTTALTRLAQKCDGLTNRAYYDLNPVGTGHWPSPSS